MSLEQAQEASGMCLRPSLQQVQAQLEEKTQQLQTAHVGIACIIPELIGLNFPHLAAFHQLTMLFCGCSS